MTLSLLSPNSESARELNLRTIFSYQDGIFPKLMNEYYKKKIDVIEIDAARKTLKDLCLIQTGNTESKYKIRRFFNLKLGEMTAIDLRSISNAYDLFCSNIPKIIYPEQRVTVKEDILYGYLKKYLRHKIIRSAWIGSHNVDFFIPRKNLVIEVDGTIHNREFKIRKDELKSKRIINDLKMNVFTILNVDVSRNGHRIKEFIKDYKPIGTKRVSKLKRDIHIETLVRFFNINELSLLFGMDLYPIYLWNLETILKKRKGKAYGRIKRTRGRKHLNGRDSF